MSETARHVVATYEMVGAGGAVLDTVRVTSTGDGDGLFECSTGQARRLVEAAVAAHRTRGLPVGDLDGYESDAGRLVWAPTVPNVRLDLREAGGDAKLRAYWTHGKGATKINWGSDGDFDRCVRHLGKYVSDPKGLCNEYHQGALGAPPGKGH